MEIISKFNWLDYITCIVFLFYALEGFNTGFIRAGIDFISFILSFILALKFYSFIGNILFTEFYFPHAFANGVGFFITAIFFVFLFNMLLSRFLRSFVDSITIENSWIERVNFLQFINKIFGIIPGVISASILLSFLFTTIVAFPLSPFVKQAVSTSIIGNFLVGKTQGLEQSVNTIFGGSINETLSFFTIEPKSNETINLKFTIDNAKTDDTAKSQMLILVNKERIARGLAPLIIDDSLSNLAYSHGADMFKRGYFSHNTPESYSPFDRMAKANIIYSIAGENLALAPNVDLAMQGLMNSPGHRDNILSPAFHKIGIGVLDGGIHGEMFVQEFTD